MTSGQLPLSLASTGQCFNLQTEDKSSDNNSKLLNKYESGFFLCVNISEFGSTYAHMLIYMHVLMCNTYILVVSK